MHWQDAVRRSETGKAIRLFLRDPITGEYKYWIRGCNGLCWQGFHPYHPVEPQNCEGYDDWYPEPLTDDRPMIRVTVSNYAHAQPNSCSQIITVMQGSSPCQVPEFRKE
jgi:hypothetical protein